MRPLLRLLPLLVVAPLFGGSCAAPAPAPKAPSAPAVAVADTARLRGVVLDARRPFDEALLDTLAAWGAAHAVVCPYGFSPTLDAPAVRGNGGGWYSESDDGIRQIARAARTRGLTVVIKPHLWVRGAFTGEVAMRSEADWQAWEASYRAFLLPYARLSAEIGAPWFVIGSELGTAARTREAFWRGLIDSVRAVYPGKVTYAANWHADVETVPFWDALDAIGVQAYFPLVADTLRPTAEAAARGWAPHLATLERLAQQHGRPVVFTELGYRSAPGAAREPWAWAERAGEHPADAALQADLYRAFFAAVWPRPWFGGVFVWKAEPPAEQRPARHAVDFSPQGKPAAAVLRAGWARPAPPAGR